MTAFSDFGRRWVQLPGASAAFAIVQSFVTALIREKLTANRTYYVRTDGSDSNTGLADTAGGAFLTIQKAIDVVAALDISIYDVTIQVRDGTWTVQANIAGPWVGRGTVTLLGNTSTPANCILNVTNGRCVNADGGGKITVSGFEFRTTTSGDCLVVGSPGSQITIGAACRFGASAGAHINAFAGYVLGRSNYSIVGSSVYHYLASTGGIVDVQGVTITLTGTPAFSGAFALTSQLAMVLAGFNTFSGAATGTRYSASTNSVIGVNGGGATYLPGNVGGATATGGQYA